MTRTERASFWLGHIEAQHRSGLSQSRYCAAHDLSAKSFSYWHRKQRRGARASTREPVASKALHWVPLQLIEEQAPTGGVPGSGVRLHAARVTIELALQFDAPTLQRVLSVLEGHPC